MRPSNFLRYAAGMCTGVLLLLCLAAADPSLNTWLAKTRGGSAVGGTTNKFHFVPLLNSNGVLDASFTSGSTLTNALVIREVPAGVLNGTNFIFALTNAPVYNSESVFFNGLLQDVGVSNDYVITNKNIYFTSPPDATDKILVNYLK